MNIIHIGVHYTPKRGGGNLRNSFLLNQFKKTYSNNQVYIISYKSFNNEKNKKDVFYSNSVLKQFLITLYIILRKKINIIHCHNPRVFILISLFFFRKKIILELHSFQRLSKIKDFIFKKLLKRASLIIVLGKGGKELLKSKYEIDNNKVKIISNGFKKIYKQNVTGNSKILKNMINVSYIGSFYDWQGVFNFVTAIDIYVKRYASTNVTFKMIGGGKEFDNVKDMIKNKKLSNFISLTGIISPNEIEKYWLDTDVLVIPRPSTQATETTVPLKLIEALSYGKAIVASNVGGLTEYLENDYNALIYDNKNMEELSRLINVLVESPNLRYKISKNATSSIEKLSSWQNVSDKLYNSYKQVLDKC